MAIPLVAAAGAGLAKLGIGAKLAGALAKAKGLVGMGKAAGATQLGLPGIGSNAAMTGTRMAGTKLASSPMFTKGIGNAVFGDMTRGQIATRLAPDVAFGVIGGAMTPGDLGDKLIAGGTQAIGGGIGGLAVGRGLGKIGAGETVQTIGDFMGSYGGDFAGMAVGDTIMRGKDKLMGGAGQTPYERLSAEQQALLADQIRRQAVGGATLVPGFQEQFSGLGTGLGVV